MLTLDDVESGSLVPNKSYEVSVSKVLFRASVKQGQVEIYPVKPCFKQMPVLLNIN